MRWLRVCIAALAAVAGGSGAAEFEVDSSHLSVCFAVSHFDISFVRGRFGRIDAKVQYDPEARTGTVVVTVDAGSIDTGNATLDGVLRSPQFLDAGVNPEIRFLGERFVFEGSQLLAVDGRLLLHGILQPLRLNVERFVCKAKSKLTRRSTARRRAGTGVRRVETIDRPR